MSTSVIFKAYEKHSKLTVQLFTVIVYLLKSTTKRRHILKNCHKAVNNAASHNHKHWQSLKRRKKQLAVLSTNITTVATGRKRNLAS